MFSTKTAVAVLLALRLSSGAVAQEKQLSLDDIDGLARQKIIDSMRKTPEGVQAQSNGLNTPLTGAASAPDAPAPKPSAQKPIAQTRHAAPITFFGAYSDATGAYVLYDYQGAIYPGKRGTKLLNGWVVTALDGYSVTVSEGKRTWTEVIASAVPVPVPTSAGIQAITDLGGPLPAPAVGGMPAFVPLGK
jgi:hypothetical protein